MLRRVPHQVVRDLSDVIAAAAEAPAPATLILDIDNTLAPQGAPLAQFRPLVNAALDRIEAAANIARVIPLTNGPQREVARLISRGNKPWTSRRRLGLRGVREGVFVVGDQILTDGVLAWRLGADFLQLVIDEEAESTSQAMMRRIGRRLVSLMFVPRPTQP